MIEIKRWDDFKAVLDKYMPLGGQIMSFQNDGRMGVCFTYMRFTFSIELEVDSPDYNDFMENYDA